MNSRVGHTPLPELQVPVLGFQRSERVPLERVAFHITDAALDLALVPRRAGLGGQDHRTIVLTEREQLGIQLGIKPVGMRDGRLEVVDHQRLGHSAEMPEGILDRPQEVVGRLAKADFTVGFTRMREHDAKDVRLAPLAGTDRRLVRQRDRHAGAEVDLSLFARRDFHATHRQGRPAGQPLDESPYAPVAGRETLIGHEVLVNPLRRKTLLQLGQDQFAVGLARATLTGQACRAMVVEWAGDPVGALGAFGMAERSAGSAGSDVSLSGAGTLSEVVPFGRSEPVGGHRPAGWSGAFGPSRWRNRCRRTVFRSISNSSAMRR